MNRRLASARVRHAIGSVLPIAIAAGVLSGCGRSPAPPAASASANPGAGVTAAATAGRTAAGSANAASSASSAAPTAAGQPAPPPPPSPVTAELAAIVEAHRQIIVLLEDEASFEREDRRRADLVSRLLFHENHQRTGALGTRLQADLTREGGQGAEVAGFLDLLESQADLRDADKLAFRDLVTELTRAARAQPSQGAAATMRARLESDDAALADIQKRYDAELEKIFGRFETRGMTIRRESWESYVTFLRGRYKPSAILDQHAGRIRDIVQARKGAGASATAAAASEESGKGEILADRSSTGQPSRLAAPTYVGAREINGGRLPPKGVVLTFDDGPHPKHTDEILAILKKYGVKAVFFHVGKNLGSPTATGIQPTSWAAASKRLLAEGHTLANHSYSHELLPKLSDAELADQIELTERMLRSVAPNATGLFRPPYGARNDKVRAALEARRMLSVMWNVDSKDWADPIPRSIANRVIRETEGQRQGIILFHDIQARTVDALPSVIETLQGRGYRFLTWKGSSFVDENPPPAPAQLTEKTASAPSPYRESWAVVVGIDQYKHWPRLSYASNDARGVRDVLINKYRFNPAKVITLLNEAATREAILAALGDTLADATKVSRDDRVFVFFAGHGITRRAAERARARLPRAGGCGSRALSEPGDLDDAPAGHLGLDPREARVLRRGRLLRRRLAMTRGAGGQSYLREVARRVARQVLTAGGADEEVADNGPNGHSIFTWTLMQGLEGRADMNGDQFITGSELAAYVGPVVSSVSRQTPAFGNLPGSEGGEFVFELPHETEFLNELSTQLDQEAITLNAELDRVRAEIAAKRARNQKLRAEITSAKAGLGTASTASAAPAATGATGAATAAAAAARTPATGAGAMTAIDRGMVHFRERRYQDALTEFLAAAQANPSNALAANNVGYTYFKMERFPEAVQWYEKTIAIDPRRSIAHANLGDALLKLDRRDDARVAYEKFFALSPPQNRYTTTVREKLTSLGGGTRPQ